MAISFSLKWFPISGALKEECGLPFSCVVQPFARVEPRAAEGGPMPRADTVSRCQQCFSYINHCCTFSLQGWTCALCGHLNEYHSLTNQRYARPSARATCPELLPGLVELECTVDSGLAPPNEEGGGSVEVAATPLYIALVDLSGSAEYLELVRSALLAALESLPPSALFALITFSDTVSLYDVRARAPSILSVPLVEEAGERGEGPPTACELAAVLPLDCVLAPLALRKDAITAAIDALEEAQMPAGTAARGFGGALQAVLRYLKSASQLREQRGRGGGADEGASGRSTVADTVTFAGARLLTFLSGPPNYGRGSINRPVVVAPQTDPSGYMYNATFPDISPYSYPDITPAANSTPAAATTVDGVAVQERDPEARGFYEQAAGAAASLGVCIDVFAVTGQACGLDAIEPLARLSGGAVCLYPSIPEAALPQDVYRRLSQPSALAGLLRLRTSHEFRSARAYGHLFPDREFENLAHVIAADPHASFVFDFEFESAGGFSSAPDEPPVVQMVFQYSQVVPADERRASRGGQPNGEESPADRRLRRYGIPRSVLRRRLRILTLAVDVARSPRALYTGVDPAVVICVLTHKISRAVEAEGVQEARALLQDWLVILMAGYNRRLEREHGTPIADSAQMDVMFEGAEGLQAVARSVYALLRSPLLSPRPSAHPDAAVAASHLWAALPPDELQRAIYPVLSSYTDPDTLAFPRHSLSRAALVSSGSPIFLLDTFTSLVVYYVAGYPPSLPFPPPQHSLLRRTINSLRQNRRLTPTLRMLRGGLDDVTPFTDYLIEEPGPGPDEPGFVGFLQDTSREAWSYMQES